MATRTPTPYAADERDIMAALLRTPPPTAGNKATRKAIPKRKPAKRRKRVSRSVIGAALVLVAFAALLAGVSEHGGAVGFIKKWVVWIVVLAGFVVSGVFLGAIMRNALCAGLWVCK